MRPSRKPRRVEHSTSLLLCVRRRERVTGSTGRRTHLWLPWWGREGGGSLRDTNRDALVLPRRSPLEVLLVLNQPVRVEVITLALAHVHGDVQVAVVALDLAQSERLARLGSKAPPQGERVPVVALTRRGIVTPY